MPALPPQGVRKIATYYIREVVVTDTVNRIAGINGEEGSLGLLDALEIFASRPTRIIEVAVDVRTNTLTEDLNLQLTVDGAGNNASRHVVATLETGIVRFTNTDGYWGDYTLEQAWAVNMLAEATATGTANVKITITVEYLD